MKIYWYKIKNLNMDMMNCAIIIEDQNFDRKNYVFILEE